MAIAMGWHWGLLCGFAAPLEMLVVPWGNGTIEDCGSGALSTFMLPLLGMSSSPCQELLPFLCPCKGRMGLLCFRPGV